MKWRSFRVRLTLWNVGVLALVLGGFGYAICHRVQVEMLSSIDKELSARGHFYASRWSTPMPPFSPGRGGMFVRPMGRPGGPPAPSPAAPANGRTANRGRFASEAEKQGYFRRPRLLDLDGGPLIPFQDDRAWDMQSFVHSAAGEDRFSTTFFEGEKIRVFSLPILREGKSEGVIQVAHPLDDMDRVTQGQVNTLLALLPLAVAVAGLGGMFLAERALRPVRGVTQAAAEIGAADLSRRLNVTGEDELSELAATFNMMIARLEEAFQSREAAYQKLETAYEQQRRFTADASHELRTPLTRIKGATSLALFGERTPDEYRMALRTADQAADVMGRLIQDLLLLARSDSGHLQIEKQPLDVGTIVRQVVAGASRREAATVVADLPAEPVGVLGNADHLSRLLGNLVENALRHTPPGGEVRISARPAGDAVLLTVADTGEGIPSEHLPHIFQRFYRVDPARTRNRGGTGLGLAICRSIVEAHEGSIEVESELGRGTLFLIRLPGAALTAVPRELTGIRA